MKLTQIKPGQTYLAKIDLSFTGEATTKNQHYSYAFLKIDHVNRNRYLITWPAVSNHRFTADSAIAQGIEVIGVMEDVVNSNMTSKINEYFQQLELPSIDKLIDSLNVDGYSIDEVNTTNPESLRLDTNKLVRQLCQLLIAKEHMLTLLEALRDNKPLEPESDSNNTTPGEMDPVTDDGMPYKIAGNNVMYSITSGDVQVGFPKSEFYAKAQELLREHENIIKKANIEDNEPEQEGIIF